MADSTQGAMEYPSIARLREALQDIVELVMQLPGGIDEDPDPDDTSPDNPAAHIGGLIIECAELVGIIPHERRPICDGSET